MWYPDSNSLMTDLLVSLELSFFVTKMLQENIIYCNFSIFYTNSNSLCQFQFFASYIFVNKVELIMDIENTHQYYIYIVWAIITIYFFNITEDDSQRSCITSIYYYYYNIGLYIIIITLVIKYCYLDNSCVVLSMSIIKTLLTSLWKVFY